MRRAGFATVVVVALLLALPACGKKTDETARAAGITPASALGFLSVSLDPSIEQKRNLLGIARRFPDAEVKDDFNENRDELLSTILQEAGLNYEEDVKPWLGSELAVAVLPAEENPQPLVAVLIEQDDDEQAKAALDKANARAEAEGGPPIAYRLVDEFVVATDGSDAGLAEQTLAAFTTQAEREDGDLSQSKEFAEVVDELHGDRLLLGWVDSKAALEEMGRFLDGGDFPLDSLLDEAVPMAFDVHAARSALVMEAVARSTTDASDGKPVLTEGLPEGSLGSFTVFDVGGLLRDGLQAALGTGGDVLAEIERETGINVERDVLSWMGGEAVLVGAPATGDGDIPEFGLIIEPTDRAAAEAALPKLRAALADIDTEDVQPAMELFDDRFVAASSAAYLDRLSKDASPSFGDSDPYRSVLGEASSDNTRAQLVLDIDAIREVIEGFLGDDDRAGYEQDAKPKVEPLDAFGFLARRDGEFDRVELKLTFD